MNLESKLRGCTPKKTKKLMPSSQFHTRDQVFGYLLQFLVYSYFGFLGFYDFLRKYSSQLLIISHGEKRENWLLKKNLQNLV
jgi:hypothetical protein